MCKITRINYKYTGLSLDTQPIAQFQIVQLFRMQANIFTRMPKSLKLGRIVAIHCCLIVYANNVYCLQLWMSLPSIPKTCRHLLLSPQPLCVNTLEGKASVSVSILYTSWRVPKLCRCGYALVVSRFSSIKSFNSIL